MLKKPVVISTGTADLKEIEHAVKAVKNNKNDKIILLHCVSAYPTPPAQANLLFIEKLREIYGPFIGYSDHTMDNLPCLLSIANGAKVIEKHFTLNKASPGPDHFFALDPVELDLMVQSIRKAEKSLGSGIKEVLKTEKELRNFAKRSIQAICKIPKGQELIEGVNFDVLRPGKKSRGLEPRFLDSLNGKKSKTDIDDGEGITDNS